MARATTSARRFHSGEPGVASGRQRRQARNPACWAPAALGQDLGRFAFRPWSYRFSPATRGKTVVMARATNMIGQSQTTDLIQNPAGYHHNVVQAVTLVVS